MKTKTVEAIEYNGRLYHSIEELEDHRASSIIYEGRSNGSWATNPRRIYEQLKEIYGDD